MTRRFVILDPALVVVELNTRPSVEVVATSPLEALDQLTGPRWGGARLVKWGEAMDCWIASPAILEINEALFVVGR